MPLELKVPSVGESITEVEISEWQKAEGESVKRDEVVAILETEKVTVELPAPGEGVITKILKKKGETAKVGDVIGYMEVDGKREKEPGKEPPEAEPQRDTQEKKRETKTGEVEKGFESPAPDRAGPFDTPEEAAKAPEVIKERSRAWAARCSRSRCSASRW